RAARPRAAAKERRTGGTEPRRARWSRATELDAATDSGETVVFAEGGHHFVEPRADGPSRERHPRGLRHVLHRKVLGGEPAGEGGLEGLLVPRGDRFELRFELDEPRRVFAGEKLLLRLLVEHGIAEEIG